MLTIYKSDRGYFLAEEGLTDISELDLEDTNIRKSDFFKTEEEAKKFIENMKKWGIM